MKFNVSNFHSIFESAKEEQGTSKAVQDQTGANLDNTLGSNDLLSIFNDICPITGDVYAAMKNAASDPKNLKITMVKDGTGTASKMFVEAIDLANFCEAADLTPYEAKEEIIKTYEDDIPGVDDAELHVVFPDECINKNTIGGENLGRAVNDDWAMQLMRGCRRYGIHVNSGVEGNQKNDSLNEGFFGFGKKNSTPDNVTYVKRYIVSDVNNNSGADDLMELAFAARPEKNQYYFLYGCGDSGSSGRSLKVCRDYIIKNSKNMEDAIKKEKGYNVSISFEYHKAFGALRSVVDEMEYLKIVVK